MRIRGPGAVLAGYHAGDQDALLQPGPSAQAQAKSSRYPGVDETTDDTVAFKYQSDTLSLGRVACQDQLGLPTASPRRV